MSLALGARSLNHWTTSEVPIPHFKMSPVTKLASHAANGVTQAQKQCGQNHHGFFFFFLQNKYQRISFEV